MAVLTRRSVLRGSVGLAAAGVLTRPHVAHSAATTAEVWWNQGFAPEEDVAFCAMVADYEKASGNSIDFTILPNASLRQKEVSAIASGVVPDVMEVADFRFAPLNVWEDKLLDISDVVEPQKSQFSPVAVSSCYLYNNVTKQRSCYVAPVKMAGWLFHMWRPLLEKAGYKIENIPNTWDAFLDFFKPVQDELRAQGMPNIYAYGYQLIGNGFDPIATFNAFTIAYGGKDLVTPDGKLHTDDPWVREAAIKAMVKLTMPFKLGYVPPAVVGWRDVDYDNAFHAKLIVMDFVGSASTEVALCSNREDYDDIVSKGHPLSNDRKQVPAQIGVLGPAIPKGATNVAVAKEFIKYAIQPKVLNQYLKAGRGRWMLPVPEVAKADPFWFHQDPHRTVYAEEALVKPTLPLYEAFNPAMAEVNAEHVFSIAMLDVMNNGMTSEQAIDKAFARAEAIFTKYPIAQA